MDLDNKNRTGWLPRKRFSFLCKIGLLAAVFTQPATRGLEAPSPRAPEAQAVQSSPSFLPPPEKWTRIESAEDLGQPVVLWNYKEKPELRVIHYITKQSKEATVSWEELLKKTCSLLLPELSAALGTNVTGPKEIKIGSVPGCLLRITAPDGSVTEHHVFIWYTRKERSEGIYQGHTVTVNYPANYLAQGHEAVEKFFASIKMPRTAK